MPTNELPALEPLIALLRTVAAEEIMPRYGHVTSSAKADGSLVTAADLSVQRRLTAGLAELHPHLPLLGEEQDAAEQQRLLGDGQGAFWCLDPVDGTSNFACGFPGFAISLALIRAGRVELGLVLDPVRDECFSATRGGGARCNGEPIAPYAPGPALADGLAMMDLKRLPVERLPRLLAGGSFRSQRNIGAVALEWCWLAAGRFQLYLHGSQGLWDYAAGHLIASEAGCSSALYARDGVEPLTGIGLDRRVALAAANPSLFVRWRDLVGLPLWT